ncbi:MAG TPA: cupin domain-containing protein [Tepidisphaeraceae bacterium]|nr:cupin domain-containing protein [Tepidisphaeraceae bacterium]
MVRISTAVAAVLLMGVLSSAAMGQTTRPTTMPSQVFNWDQMKVDTTAIGEKRNLMRMETATLSELEIHITTLKPGEQSHPPHKHPYEEMMLLKEGTLEATINGKTFPMPQGSIFVVAPNDLHNVRNVGTTPATYFVVSWKTPKTGKP